MPKTSTVYSYNIYHGEGVGIELANEYTMSVWIKDFKDSAEDKILFADRIDSD